MADVVGPCRPALPAFPALLIELAGWQATSRAALSMEKSNVSMTTATRATNRPAARPLVPGAIPWCRRACGMDLRLTLQSAI